MGSRVYCSSCGEHQPFRVDPMQSDNLNGEKIWGDLCCSECHLVIATFTVDAPGIYEFARVRDLEKAAV